MIVSSGTKKPKIHSSAYVAPTATVAGDVTIGAECAVLHGAVITSEGAAVTIGAQSVIMENAVLKASGGNVLRYPLSIGARCIVGPHAYVVGATIGDGCFVASGAKIFNGAKLEDGSGVALGGIVHLKTRLPAGASVPMQHVAYGDPATIYPPEQAPGDPCEDRFLRRRIQPRAGRGRAGARRRDLRKVFAESTRAGRGARGAQEHQAAAAPLGRGAAADASRAGRQGGRRHDARARRDGAPAADGD